MFLAMGFVKIEDDEVKGAMKDLVGMIVLGISMINYGYGAYGHGLVITS
jgi:hypothetical protein